MSGNTRFATGKIQRGTLPGRQRGVVLILTLIVLIAMTLAAIALVRSVDTTNVVAGNMAFKQGATLAGDIGTEAAINWLSARAGTSELYNANPAAGYYPYSPNPAWDMTGNSGSATRARVNWDLNDCNGQVDISLCFHPSDPVPGAGTGTEVKYVIHRLCLEAGDSNSATNNCATTASTAAGVSVGAKDYTSKAGLTGVTQVEYYRITSRIRGPRHTLSYVETIVHF